MPKSAEAVTLLAGVLLAGAAIASADELAAHLRDPVGDRMPRQTVTPAYPAHALDERLEGEVQVCFHVDREGQTSRIAVRRSSHRIFEQPAIAAVRASSYTPLQDDEVLPAIKTCRTFRFRLSPVAIEDPGDASSSVDEP